MKVFKYTSLLSLLLVFTYLISTTFLVIENKPSKDSICLDIAKSYNYVNTVTKKEASFVGNSCRTKPFGLFWKPLN